MSARPMRKPNGDMPGRAAQPRHRGTARRAARGRRTGARTPPFEPPPAPSQHGVIMNIPVDVQIVLGSAEMPVSELMALQKGSTVALNRRIGEPVDVVVNGRKIAKGEITVLENDPSRFGIRLTEIITGGEGRLMRCAACVVTGARSGGMSTALQPHASAEGRGHPGGDGQAVGQPAAEILQAGGAEGADRRCHACCAPFRRASSRSIVAEFEAEFTEGAGLLDSADRMETILNESLSPEEMSAHDGRREARGRHRKGRRRSGPIWKSSSRRGSARSWPASIRRRRPWCCRSWRRRPPPTCC